MVSVSMDSLGRILAQLQLQLSNTALSRGYAFIFSCCRENEICLGIVELPEFWCNVIRPMVVSPLSIRLVVHKFHLRVIGKLSYTTRIGMSRYW